jgi:predicted esterase
MRDLLVSHFEPVSEASAPLVVFVHGRGGNLMITQPFVRCVPATVHKLFVQAPYEDREVGGYSWWRLGLEDNPLESARLFKTFLSSFIETLPTQPRQIAALGFSQGGAILSIVMQQNPEYFSRVALLASFVIELEKPSKEIRSPRSAVVVIHGREDTTVPVNQAQKGVDYLRTQGYSVTFHIDEKIGHKVGVQGMKALTTWFSHLDEVMVRRTGFS